MKEAEGPEEQGYRPVYYLKFYRSMYAARLRGYDAVGFMDADRSITGDIQPYMELAAESGQIVMIDHKFSQARHEAGYYLAHPIMGTGGAPFDPAATFFNAEKWGKHFEKVHILGREVVKNSEMPTMNYMLITDNLLEEIIRLPTARWNVRRWSGLDMEWRQDEAGKYRVYIENTSSWPLECKFRELSEELDTWPWERPSVSTFDEMLAIHGRWWFRATLKKKCADPKRLRDPRQIPGYRRQNNNVRVIWETFKFFNFNCYTRLDPWMPEWGNEAERIDVDKGFVGEE